MVLSILQININADNGWDKLIPFLQKNSFDIITMQEITGKDTKVGNIDCKRDTFKELSMVLQEHYKGELLIADYTSSAPTAYFGNAIFYRNTLKLISKTEVPLYKTTTPFPSEKETFEEYGRGLLHLVLQDGEKQFSIMTTHFAWAKTPHEEPHQTKQGEVLMNYLLTVPEPFIMTGDFNLTADQPIIQKITQYAHNLTLEYKLTNTLNPRLHRVKELFPPGLAIDYIFTSNMVKTLDFYVLDEDLSDHLGLIAKVEV